LAQHAVAGEAQFLIGPLSPGIVGEAVEIEALRAQRPESLVKNEAQKRRSQALARPGDGDALEVKVGVRIAEAAQDGEGLDRVRFPDAKPVGVGGRGQHRAMLLLLRMGDEALKVRRTFDRHHGCDVGERGRAQRKPDWVHDRERFADGSRVALAIARGGASVYIPPSLSEPIVARDHGRWALSSAVEHYLDMVGVRGSIPLAPTISFNGLRETRSAAGRAG
jgi:hypothetical protein